MANNSLPYLDFRDNGPRVLSIRQMKLMIERAEHMQVGQEAGNEFLRLRCGFDNHCAVRVFKVKWPAKDGR